MELPTRLKSILQKSKQEKSDVCRTLTLFAKEFGCLGDIIGREYEFIYEKDKLIGIDKLIGMKQKPISIPNFLIAIDEWNKQVEKENKPMKNSKGRR